MNMKCLVGSAAAAVLLSLVTLGAAKSDVADAVMRGDSAAVRALLAQKADVNVAQADGATALHWAVYRDDLATTDLLIQAGANVKVANREGSTPLSLACENGDAALIESLLKAGANPNEALPRGETALMMASRTGNLAAMKLLLDRGAQVNAKETLRGTTAVMWAADQAHADAVKLLIDHGADLAVQSLPASRGRTAYLGKANDPRKSNKALVAAAAGATPEEIARLASPSPAGGSSGWAGCGSAPPSGRRAAAGSRRGKPGSA
jgi:ankyrin repeat protein